MKYRCTERKDGSPKFLSYSRFRESNNGESGSRTVLLKLPVGWDLEDLQLWAEDSFNTWCQHPYDCCGRWYRTMYTYNAKRVKSRTYYVTVDSVQNV